MLRDDIHPIPASAPLDDPLDEDKTEPEPKPDDDEDDDEWFGYRAPRRRICIDRTGGRFPGF